MHAYQLTSNPNGIPALDVALDVALGVVLDALDQGALTFYRPFDLFLSCSDNLMPRIPTETHLSMSSRTSGRHGLTVKELEAMIGKSNRIYEILNHKRSLTLKEHTLFSFSVPCRHLPPSHGIDVFCLTTRNKHHEKHH
ncbi:MAG: hypothetical protein COA75_08415 [Cellvibrionales bacterium]|nr:MAG: hypothetical protein COA75_08415 [Cellvibrionales bacterium]